MLSDTPFARLAGPVMTAIGIVMAVTFTRLFPPVEGLGTKVRLPVFHGATTWVNLTLFAVLALVAAAYLVTRRESLYSLAQAVRWVAIPLWIAGSVLGLMAAMNTWDFTGSKASPFTVAAADPRLNAQFWIMLGGMALLALGLIIDQKRWLAIVDLVFVVGAWTVLLRAILGPGRALHPDSPVMNSDEMFIKLMFIGILAGVALASAGAVLIVRRFHALHTSA